MPITTHIFPPFPAELIECRVAMVAGGIECLNVLYFFGDSGQTYAANTTLIGNDLAAFYEAAAVASLSNTWSVTNFTFIDRSVANGQEIVFTPGTPIVGDETAEVLPLQTQLCITWRTNNTGRRYRGRTYLPGWTIDSNTTAGQPESGTLSSFQAIVDDLLDDLGADDCSLAVLSRGRAGDPDASRNWEGFATPVTAGVVRGGWDVLRSRRT